jgi:hypothetical protein
MLVGLSCYTYDFETNQFYCTQIMNRSSNFRENFWIWPLALVVLMEVVEEGTFFLIILKSYTNLGCYLYVF